jgi:hypothetical protein
MVKIWNSEQQADPPLAVEVYLMQEGNLVTAVSQTASEEERTPRLGVALERHTRHNVKYLSGLGVGEDLGALRNIQTNMLSFKRGFRSGRSSRTNLRFSWCHEVHSSIKFSRPSRRLVATWSVCTFRGRGSKLPLHKAQASLPPG